VDTGITEGRVCTNPPIQDDPKEGCPLTRRPNEKRSDGERETTQWGGLMSEKTAQTLECATKKRRKEKKSGCSGNEGGIITSKIPYKEETEQSPSFCRGVRQASRKGVVAKTKRGLKDPSTLSRFLVLGILN